jgi:methylaspartate mutase epsilon subunit
VVRNLLSDPLATALLDWVPFIQPGRKGVSVHWLYTADETGHNHLWFRKHVMPLVLRELDCVYYRTHVRLRDGEQAAARFDDLFAEAVEVPDGVKKLLAEAGLDDVPPLDLERLARPFAGATFDSPDDYHNALIALLERDAAEAELGNLDGPLKAALDTLRDTRGVMRVAVEFSSLHPDSHRDEFLGWFNPINTMLSAGPPLMRIEQTVALIEAGILSVAGPGLRIRTDEVSGAFVLASPQVGQSEVSARVLIDGRIPRPNVAADASPLTRQLVDSGLASQHVNINARDGSRFTTGALAVSESPYRVIDAAGRPSRDLYAIGIPTEELRWFTQIGNGRPGPLTSFHSDADAVVRDLLATARARNGASSLAGELVS